MPQRVSHTEMRKIITFLGKYPKATSYQFAGQVYTGRVFAEALRQFVQFDEMLVFVTDEARQTAWPVLAELNDPRIKAVPIQTGESTAEIWEMFDAMTAHVGAGETVIFDITHGLRSLPFLVFLFAAYLKSAKNVKIAAVYYGAFELGGPDKPAPVIDLSSFVGMFDWLTAAERFTRYGDSQDLAALLRRAGRETPARQPLSDAADTLDRLSQALQLIRPGDAMAYSAQLPAALEAARAMAEATPSARPYTYLTSEIEQAYAPFALAAPFDPAHLAAGLDKQRRLVRWYIDHAQWVQAVSLAREWLVSWVMWQLGETDLLDRELRESIAETMSAEAQRRKAAKDAKRLFSSLLLRQVPAISDVLGLWLSLAGVRNDIDHAGMKAKPMGAAELTKSVQTLVGKLQTLPLERIPSP